MTKITKNLVFRTRFKVGKPARLSGPPKKGDRTNIGSSAEANAATCQDAIIICHDEFPLQSSCVCIKYSWYIHSKKIYIHVLCVCVCSILKCYRSNTFNMCKLNLHGSWQVFPFQYVDVSENSGTPKWMVYNGKPY